MGCHNVANFICVSSTMGVLLSSWVVSTCMISSMEVWLASLACSSLRGYSFMDIFSNGFLRGYTASPIKGLPPRVHNGETTKKGIVRRLIYWIEGRKGGGVSWELFSRLCSIKRKVSDVRQCSAEECDTFLLCSCPLHLSPLPPPLSHPIHTKEGAPVS